MDQRQRIVVQQQNELLRAENRTLRLQNARLRSKLETVICFMVRLAMCRNLFPSAASTSTWLYAVAAMTALSLQEVVSLARQGGPMWTNERLNLNEYYSNFFPWYARNSPGFVHEASRASALIPCDALSLVTTLIDPEMWPKIFPSIVAEASLESQNQDFQMIIMDFMPLIFPLIQTRHVELLRCFRQIETGTWVIADISVYFTSYGRHTRPNFMRFPSGYLVQHISNGVSRVTVLDHWVYKEEQVINQPDSGFGAHRWLSALQRHFFNSSWSWIPLLGHHIRMFDPIARTNLLNLSTRMVNLFCTGVYGVSGEEWKRLQTVRNVANNLRMFTQKGRVTSRRQVPYVLISSTGSAEMQAKPETIFGVINHAEKKDIWRYLQSVGAMNEVIRMNRSRNPGNEVSVFSIEFADATARRWCVIQETYYEASAGMIIHSFVQASSLQAVINGADLSRLRIFPCGITIVPCGQEGSVVSAGCQVKAKQDVVTNREDELVNVLGKIVGTTLVNVQNALPVSLNLR